MFLGDLYLTEFHSPTKGGLSDITSEVVILEEGDTIDPNSDLAKFAVTLYSPRVYGDNSNVVFEPYLSEPDGTVGYMASGAFVVSDDERFLALTGSDKPVVLRDRYETPEQYAALSF